MNRKTFKKVLIGIVIGILVYIVLELIINDVILASGKNKGNVEMFPFYWLLLIVSGAIVSTLSYVSWRKYRGEKEKKLKSNNNKTFD